MVTTQKEQLKTVLNRYISEKPKKGVRISRKRGQKGGLGGQYPKRRAGRAMSKKEGKRRAKIKQFYIYMSIGFLAITC